MQNYKEENKQSQNQQQQSQQKKQNFAPRLLVHKGNDLGTGSNYSQDQDIQQLIQQNSDNKQQDQNDDIGQQEDEFKKPAINSNLNGNNNNNDQNMENNINGNNNNSVQQSSSNSNFFSKMNKGQYQSNPNLGDLILQTQLSKGSNNFMHNYSSQNLLGLGQNQSSNNLNNNQQYGTTIFQEPQNFNTISQKNSEQNLRQYLQQQNNPLQQSNPNFLGQNAVLNDQLLKMYQDISYDNLFKLNNEGYNNNNNNQQILTHAFGNLGSNQSMQNLLNQQCDGVNLQLQNIKGNVKNTYIKKISNILTSGNSLDQLVNHGKNQNYLNDEYGDSEDDQQSYDNDSQGNQDLNSDVGMNKQGENNVMDGDTLEEGQGGNNKKQKKNRESARNSRQRKKMYIELLEKKVQELNTQISKASEYVTQNWETISSILQLTPYLRYLINWRHNYMQKMKQQLQLINDDQDHDPEQLSMIIDSFRLRLGSTGQLRKESVDYLFSHLLRSFLHTNYQYFMFGYDINQNNEIEEQNQCIKIFNDLGITDNHQIHRIIPIVKKLIQHRERFRSIVVKVYKIKKAFQKSALRVETLLDNFSMHLESEQIGQLITKIDENRKLFQVQLGKRNYKQSQNNQQRESIYQSENAGFNNNNNNNAINSQQQQFIQNQNLYGSMQGLNLLGNQQQQQEYGQSTNTLNQVNPQLFNFNFDILNNNQQQFLQNFNQQMMDSRNNFQQNQIKNIFSAENLNQFGNFGQSQINQPQIQQQNYNNYQQQQQPQQQQQLSQNTYQQDIDQVNQQLKQQNKNQAKSKKGKKNKDNKQDSGDQNQYKMEYDEGDNYISANDQVIKGHNNKYKQNDGQILDAIKKKVQTEFEQNQL